MQTLKLVFNGQSLFQQVIDIGVTPKSLLAWKTMVPLLQFDLSTASQDDETVEFYRQICSQVNDAIKPSHIIGSKGSADITEMVSY